MTETYTVDSGDKLTQVSVSGVATKTFGYDGAGRTTSIQTSGGTTSFTYDFESRVTGITYPNASTNSFAYNGLDTRVGKTDSAGTATYRRMGAGVTAPVLGDGSASFTPGISERRGSTSSFYGADYLGTNSSLYSSGETVSATRQYDAFGNLTSSSGSSANPFGFAGNWGYQNDSDSGLMLLGHRYYDASTGRFLTRDPIKDGRNWYAYCENDPVGWLDSSGLQRIPAHHMQALVQYVKQGSPDIMLDYMEHYMGINVPDSVKDTFNAIQPHKSIKKPDGLIRQLVQHVKKADEIITNGGNPNSVLKEIRAFARKMFGHRD